MNSFVVLISFVIYLIVLRNRKGCDAIDMVPLDEAKVRCPEIVIDYFSGLISWVKKSEEKKK